LRRGEFALIRKTAIVLAITLAIYLAVDMVAGLFIGPLHRPTPDFAAIPGFRGQPYATPGFAFEYTEMQSFDTVLGTRLLMPALRRGTYYNVDALPPTEAHYRRTDNPVAVRQPTRLVLVIGGSLVFGPAVPDGLTIPSLLARQLNAEDPSQGYRVLNAGVDGAVSGQELARLRYELAHGLKPDLVVVIDGPVDFAQGVYEGSPGGFALSGRSLIGELIHRYFPVNIYDWLRFRLGGLATDRGWRKAPAHLGDQARIARLTQESLDIYVRNQLAMARLAKNSGARFLLIVNPALESSDYAHPTGDISYARDLSNRLYPGQADIARGLRPTMAQAVQSLRSQGVAVENLSDLWRDKTVDVFVEASHFNATGHAMIAEAIAREVLHDQ
jgi:lysophospholipase L1-like esterase